MVAQPPPQPPVDQREPARRLVAVAPSLIDHAGTIQQAMQFQEAAAAHMEWMRTRLPEYDSDVRARLLVGLVLPSTLYVTAQRARRAALSVIEQEIPSQSLVPLLRDPVERTLEPVHE